MFSMSSSHPKKAQTSETLPCPECGAAAMVKVVENCQLDGGLSIKRLAHYKCSDCGERFFDDEAMRRIQAERAKHQTHSV